MAACHPVTGVATPFDIETSWLPTPARAGNVPAYTHTYAGPTASQRVAIVDLFARAGFKLSSYPTVPYRVGDQTPADDGSYQTMPMLDGRDTPFCDYIAMTSSKLLIEAPTS